MTRPSPALLHIALLGPGAEALSQSVQLALQDLLPQTPIAIHWQACLLAQETLEAQLRWLLPWDEGNNDAEASIAALQTHQALRQSLHTLGLAYQALRGAPEQCLSQALQSLLPWLPELGPLLPQTGVSSRRPGWSCSECSDPECEHRSFTELLARRPCA